MADKKISLLPAIPSPLTSAALFATVDFGNTYKATVTEVAAAFPVATGLVTGLLSSADWTTFNGKQDAITLTTTGSSGAATFIGGTLNIPIYSGSLTNWSESFSSATQATSAFTAVNAATNVNAALIPKGTGAILAQIPNGAVSGGNARGQYAIDFQVTRSAATQVASGDYAIILGGNENTVSGWYSTVAGGSQNRITNDYSFATGLGNLVKTLGASAIGGWYSTVGTFATFSVVSGNRALTTLQGQVARANGQFSEKGDAQTSSLVARRSITGTAQTELLLDGSFTKLQLDLSETSTNARAWNARIDLIAIVDTVGSGTVTLNHIFSGNYMCTIRRTSLGTAIIGPGVTVASQVWDSTMSTSVVTIDADTPGGALRIRFTPPTTAAIDTVIRVVASVYLTEVAR